MDTKIVDPHIRTAARLAWLAIALLALGMVGAGIVPFFRLLSQVCTGPGALCDQYGLVRPGEVSALLGWGLTLTSYAAINLAVGLCFKILWVGTGMALFLSRSDDWMILLVALFLVTFGLATFSQGEVNQAALAYPVLDLPARFLTFAGDVLIMAFFLLFPGGRLVPRWILWPGLIFILVSMMDYLFPGTVLDRDRWVSWLSSGFFAFQLALLLYAQVYRYRRVSNAVQRYQTRWVVAGMAGALGGLLLVAVSFQLASFWKDPATRLLGDSLITLSMCLIPLSLRVAVTRYRLWDIDFIIRRTLLYTALTMILAGTYVGLVLVFQQIVIGLFGAGSELGIVLSTLVIVVLVQPLRRRLQEWIDSRFYRRKYDAQRMLAGFSSRAGNEVDPAQIAGDLLAVVEEALQPEHKALWLKTHK
jgi:hypothetical protein